MVHEVSSASIPAIPSIVTGSQVGTRDEAAETNSAPLGPRSNATDESAFAEANRQEAAAVQPTKTNTEQLHAQQTHDRRRDIGAKEINEMPPFTGVTQAQQQVEGKSQSAGPLERVGTEPLQTGQDSHTADGATTAIAPPVPLTRGPGHTPRSARPNSTHPPQRPPSRTSSRYGTPRVSRSNNAPPAAAAVKASHSSQMARPSGTLSDRSVVFHVDDEISSTASVSFQIEQSTANRRKSEASIDRGTLTDNSDIRFSVVPESHISRPSASGARQGTEASEVHFEVEPSRGSRIPAVADRATNSMSSLQFDIDSAGDHTRHSSISHFTVENDEPGPKLVPVKRVSQVDGNADGSAAVSSPNPEEIETESEERRRLKKAEEERRRKALAQRSEYMSMRPWDTNAPHPRARRTSSQAAAHNREKQEAEKRDNAAKRHRDMYARPWRTGMATTPRKQHISEKCTPAQESLAEETGWRQTRNAGPKARPASPTSSSSAASSSSTTSPSPSEKSSVRGASKAIIPLLPIKRIFDVEEAAKFVTPAPVLKAPLQVIEEEVEIWCETVSQQRNLQSILEVMRVRERSSARLSSQQEAQENTMKHLNKELYAIRDAFVRQRGTDVTGMPVRTRREGTPGKVTEGGAASPAAQIESSAQDYILLRLYPRQLHPATDYIALKQQRSGGPTVSVLSDEDMSDGEKADFAEDIERWRAERRALRKEKFRLVHERRDLNFQMRRGSNIKEIKVTQPTSGRGPLDRRASGTETMVDIDGYDRLMDLRIAAKKADVEATNAKVQYENLSMLAVKMREQHSNDSRELADAQELQETAKERYESILQEIRHSIDAARPLVDKAQVVLNQREREAMRSDEENAQAELRGFSDAILAVRLQVDRAAAMADAAGEDEKRMRRASTPRAGLSRTATPRGSISGGTRPGVSPRGRTNSQPDIDGVFARLTGRKSTCMQGSAPAAMPPETSVQA
ncbi:hypothetical protein ABL78_6890 [Leptomonas seymouri]|uniref:Uncharacterized protein n=1 Tax=Leptomonas seymouri TaxID=5684 RepID=A0A0N1HT63_LEPSE|nr:hypothetical protein ABL78_6890 [Leptomonas seymouri]|eukprot:KPI84065.1 hypothetical protein ABL78_6890 [Leptomonas seymouri]